MEESVEKELESNHESTRERLNGMRKKTDLSDIILEKEKSTNDKSKKLILGAASLILLFLIFLIISKMINTSSTDTEQSKNDVKKEEIIKDTNVEDKVLTSTTKTPAIKKTLKEPETKKENLKDTDLKFEEMVKKLREEDAKENGSDEVVKVVTPPKKTVEPKKLVAVNENKKVSKPKIVITDVSKPTAKKVVQKKAPKQKSYIPSFSTTKAGYYIQVGATTSPTPNRFLVNKIRSNGFNYVTHPIVVKGRKFYKILIGPYKTRNAAGADMDRVRTTINPKAFFYHIR